MEPLDAVAAILDRFCGFALAPLALWILVSGLDDLVTLCAYLRARWTGQLPVPNARNAASQERPQLRIAIFVPLWKEEAVIGGMLDHNLAAIGYRNYDFFVGAYPNDPPTIRAVRAVAARSRQVHLAECPHDGPTSKADCLNWIYQRMLLYEREHAVQFDVVMLHDAEDLIHPDELALVNRYGVDFDMIQVPVLPLPTPLGDWVHGIYCDDFAEFHTKDLPARWCLGGFIPSSGVGTAFSRRAIEALASSDSNLIFRPDSLTEDYEAGFRLRKLGFSQLFLPVAHTREKGSPPVATREYFPRTFRAARRQRTRWTTGIALQAWARHGWGSNWCDRYWFWRDRKGLVGNPASLGANLIFIYGTATWLVSLATGGPWGLGNSTSTWGWMLLPWTASVGILLGLARAVCSASLYGWRFALLSPLRSIAGNLLNSMAAAGALNRFLRSIWLGEPLVWLKTEHAYPNLAALDNYKPPLESVLVSMGAVGVEAMAEAKCSLSLVSLSERLLEMKAVSEDDLLEAMMLRHRIEGGEVPAKKVNPALIRLLPEFIRRSARVVPIGLEEGVLKLACPDLPAEAEMSWLNSQVRLTLKFHLVTHSNFAELRNITNSLQIK